MFGSTLSKPTFPSRPRQTKTSAPPFYERRTFTRKTVQDASFTVSQGPDIIAYTTLTGAKTVTLPPARSMPNRFVVIKDEAGTAGVNNITIQPIAPETIDGAASVVINTNFGLRRVYSNGTNWFTS